MCVGERERKREEKSKQQREKDRDGGGDLSQELEAYPGSTLGSSLDIAVSKPRIRKRGRRRMRTEKSTVTCDTRALVHCKGGRQLKLPSIGSVKATAVNVLHVGILLRAYKEV